MITVLAAIETETIHGLECVIIDHLGACSISPKRREVNINNMTIKGFLFKRREEKRERERERERERRGRGEREREGREQKENDDQV